MHICILQRIALQSEPHHGTNSRIYQIPVKLYTHVYTGYQCLTPAIAQLVPLLAMMNKLPPHPSATRTTCLCSLSAACMVAVTQVIRLLVSSKEDAKDLHVQNAEAAHSVSVACICTQRCSAYRMVTQGGCAQHTQILAIEALPLSVQECQFTF